MGMMGYQTPNIDRIATEGAKFTDYYGQQSCTAGRSAFITGQSPIRTGLTQVGVPGADLGIRPEDVTLNLAQGAGLCHRTVWKDHLGDRDEFLPTEHGFDGSLAISITSTPRKSLKTPTTRRIRLFGNASAPGVILILQTAA